MLSVASAGKPYKLPDPPNSLGGTLANPSLKEGGSGYAFTICNTSKTASHVIYGINVKLEQFAAYSDPVNTWQFCDGYNNRSNGVFSGGCGGGFQFDETLHATFVASDTTGAEVTATQTGTTTYGDVKIPPLPVAIGPGQQLIFNLGLTPPKAIGFYTFGFSVSLDGAQPAHISTMAATLFDSKAVRWDGKACSSNPAMLNQIPESDMSDNYICPE